MSPDPRVSVPREILDDLIDQGAEAFRDVLEKLMNLAMQIERSEFLGAAPYVRSPERRGHANGFKDKKMSTRVGKLDLKIPQVRGLSFYPQSLERGCRAETALKLAISEMWVMGVSTRKVTEITQALCGTEVSASQVSRMSQMLDEELQKFRSRQLDDYYPIVYLDAHYEKVRVDGQVRDMAILKAIGVNRSGNREVLGVSADLSEADVHWRRFLEGLQSRGLKGVELIVSDDHAGLKAARRAVFPSLPWQRCQFHLSQNAQKLARSRDQRGEIAEAIRDIFNAPSRHDAESLLKRHVEAFRQSNTALADWMEENLCEGFAVYDFPRSAHRRIRTVNGLENLNKQIRRRTRVVGIFPNPASALRLISAVLVEIHDDWITGRQYLNLDHWSNQESSTQKRNYRKDVA